MSAWGDLKAEISAGLGIERDLLHIPGGILLFVLLVVALRRRRHGVGLAFLGVLALQILNETLDAMDWFARSGEIRWDEALSDTLLTITLPAVFLAAYAILTAGTKKRPRAASADPARRAGDPAQ